MEQSINPHAYCRLRFDEAAEEAIENLANVLQWHRNSAHEGLFVAQKDARAGTSNARSRETHSSRANFSLLLRLRNVQSFFVCARLSLSLSLSLSARVLSANARRSTPSSLSLSLSLLPPRVRVRASFESERERERERWKIFSKRRSLLVVEKRNWRSRSPRTR